MNINGKSFKIYLSDTVKDIKDRVAVEMFPDVLPRFLRFDPDITSPGQTGDIRVTNMIKQFLGRRGDFPGLEYDDVFGANKVVKREEVERLFVMTHKDIVDAVRPGTQQRIPSEDEEDEELVARQKAVRREKRLREEEERRLQFVSIPLSLMGGLTTVKAIDAWKTRERIEKQVLTELRDLTKQVSLHRRAAEEFERIQEIPGVTPFELSQVDVNLTFKATIPHLILAELFNRIRVTKYVPYVTMQGAEGNLYKLLYNFQPNPDWLNLEVRQAILMKVDCELSKDLPELKDKTKKYTNAAFTIVQGKDEGAVTTIYASISVNVGPRNITKDIFIDRVLEAIPILNRSMLVDEKETFITGHYSIASQFLMIPVWAELMMNNHFFFNVAALNETIKASRVRNVYMYMTTAGIYGTHDTISIVPKKTVKPNQFGMRNVDEPYLRLRVRCHTHADVVRYIKTISRLVTLYTNEKEGIIKEYRSLIPRFLVEEVKEEEEIIKAEPVYQGLRAIVPDLFVATYSRKCLKQPTIISDKEAEALKKKGRHILKFPLYGEGPQHNYFCDIPSHPFPGLRVNTLDNKDKYPYLPCCYSKDQRFKQGSKLNQYVNKGPVKQRILARPSLPEQALESDTSGVLPPNLKRLFSLIDSDADHCFVRLGVNIHSLSLIEAVMVALGRLNNIDVDERLPFVRRERDRIATLANAMAARQELFDETPEAIVHKMQTVDMKATEFVHLMEEVYNVNIFVFSTDQTPRGEMVIPRHTYGYRKAEPVNRNTILIFQYKVMDDRSQDRCDDLAPREAFQCDLIVRIGLGQSPNAPVKAALESTLFEPNSHVVKQLWIMFNRLNRSFIFDKVIPELRLPSFLASSVLISTQIVDFYGKCRVLVLANGISLVTDPLPPFAVPQATTLTRVSVKTIADFARENSITLIKQRASRSQGTQSVPRIREVVGTISGITITFLTNDTQRLSAVPMVSEPQEYNNILVPQKTIITRFGRNKKMAKVIFQYAIWLFSSFLAKDASLNRPEQSNVQGGRSPWVDSKQKEQALLQFSKKGIVIIPNHKYDGDTTLQGSLGIASRFSLNSQFVAGGKLVVTSHEMIRRIIFMIKLFWDTHTQELTSYHTRVNIGDFFDELSDFDPMQGGVILEGLEGVREIIKSSAMKNTITKTVQPTLSTPYFFYNSLIEGEHIAKHIQTEGEDRGIGSIYLAQNAPSLGQAIEMVQTWHRFGYNPGPTVQRSSVAEDVEDPPGTIRDNVVIFGYVNDNDITRLNQPQHSIPGAVLGYLVNGEKMFTALMPV